MASLLFTVAERCHHWHDRLSLSFAKRKTFKEKEVSGKLPSHVMLLADSCAGLEHILEILMRHNIHYLTLPCAEGEVRAIMETIKMDATIYVDCKLHHRSPSPLTVSLLTESGHDLFCQIINESGKTDLTKDDIDSLHQTPPIDLLISTQEELALGRVPPWLLAFAEISHLPSRDGTIDKGRICHALETYAGSRQMFGK